MKRRNEGISSKDSVTVNFKGVGSRNRVVAAGNYRVIVEKVTKGVSKSGNPKLDWVFVVSAGPEAGHRFFPYVTSLQKQSLWNLRATLEALGVEVPEEDLQIVFKELKGLELGLTIEHETYQNKVKERIVDLFPLEELVEAVVAEEEDEEEMKKIEAGEMPKDRLISDEEVVKLHEREATKKDAEMIKLEEGETEEEEEEEEDEEDE